MLTPTHLAAGYLVLSSTRSFYEPKAGRTEAKLEEPKSWSWLFVVGLLVSVGIDLDGLWVSNPNHHVSLLHCPVFWISLFFLFSVAGILTVSQQLKGLGVVLLLSGLTHLFLDTFCVTIGIFWLWPFSMREFSFWPLIPPQDTYLEQLRLYFSQPRIFIELGLIIFTILKFLDDRRHREAIAV